MLRFVIRKMLNKKWMIISLLIGNILLISIAAASPIYTKAVLERTLQTVISDATASTGHDPMSYEVSTNSTSNLPANLLKIMDILKRGEERFGLPVSAFQANIQTLNDTVTTDLVRDDRSTSVKLGMLSDLSEHISVIDGKCFSDDPVEEDGSKVYEAMLTLDGMKNGRFLLGETLTFGKFQDPDGKPLKVRIVGVFEKKDQADIYWSQNLSEFKYQILIPDKAFLQIFMQGTEKIGSKANFVAHFDYTGFKVAGVDRVLSAQEELDKEIKNDLGCNGSNRFSALLTNFKKTASKVSATFLILQAPIFVLLAAFIFMVSKQMLDMEQGEIAVLKSRGSSRGQVIGVYFLQSTVTTAVAFVIGVPLAFLLVRVLGATNAFLEFIQRKSLPVELTGEALIYALAASVFSVLTMVIPVIKHSNVTIVNHKQTKHRDSDTPLWQRLFLDVIILGVSIYGLYSFNNQKDQLSQRVLEGESLDPLLFLSASLFILGAGLFALRVIPWIVKLIFTLFKRQWSPALYTSFVRVMRTKKQQGFITVFLVMTIALGVFNASAARTINTNDERNLRYSIGADLVVKENWKDNAALRAENPDIELEYEEPDFNKYKLLDGAESITKVVNDPYGTVILNGGSVSNVQIMGIHTKDFGKTAWFDQRLLSEHWYEYLNAISQKSTAVLVSSNFRDNYKYQISDVILYRGQTGVMTRGVIYGFVDYWPGYSETTVKRGDDGKFREEENYLVVANLSQLQEIWGVTPYEVWIKAKDSTAFMYDFAQQKNLNFKTFKDATAELVAHKNDAVMQGTNGILTIGFVAVLVLCFVGFLIYWILSIRSRELQFGIFRAMGMAMREIITILINEHIWISGASILVGVGVGKLTSKLFMPLIQIAYSSAENALPLEVVSDPSDDIRLAIIIAVMILLCLVILGAIIRKMKIAQALKLGED